MCIRDSFGTARNIRGGGSLTIIATVLVEGESKKNKEVLTGRTSTNKIVLFKGDKNLEGTFVNVKINDCKTWTLYGEIVE